MIPNEGDAHTVAGILGAAATWRGAATRLCSWREPRPIPPVRAAGERSEPLTDAAHASASTPAATRLRLAIVISRTKPRATSSPSRLRVHSNLQLSQCLPVLSSIRA
jgi:hypothetical protein